MGTRSLAISKWRCKGTILSEYTTRKNAQNFHFLIIFTHSLPLMPLSMPQKSYIFIYKYKNGITCKTMCWDLEENHKNLFCSGKDYRLWCCVCILFLVSQLTDKRLHTHHLILIRIPTFSKEKPRNRVHFLGFSEGWLLPCKGAECLDGIVWELTHKQWQTNITPTTIVATIHPRFYRFSSITQHRHLLVSRNRLCHLNKIKWRSAIL